MANCTSPSGLLDAENDIVGPGALAAFFITAAITYLTVIFAYITDTLDRDLINPFDAKVVAMTRKLLFRSKPRNQNPEVGIKTTAATRRDQSDDASRKARKDAVSNFLISLSDQQLVTGLAVLVAAVSGQQTLTGYDFSVATCLGWFSCTTHLTTIDVLCVHFQRHRVIRHFRVAGLICLMGLLSYAFIRTTSITIFEIPIDCPGNEPSLQFYVIPSLLPLWIDYFSAVRKIYLGPLTSFWDVAELRSSRDKESRRDEVHTDSATDQKFTSRMKQLTATKHESRSKEILDLIDKPREHARSRLGLFFYDGSFLETFPDMTYSFCFGIAQVVVYRWDSPELSEESTEMGFGQITALLLLFLPFLAIGEAYASYRATRKDPLGSEATEEDENGVAGYLDRATQACSQTGATASIAETPDHRGSNQYFEEAAASLQRATHSDDHISLEPTHSGTPETSRGTDVDQHLSDAQAFEHGRSLEDVKDLDRYFPLEMKKLSALNQSRDLATLRENLLSRYNLIKNAEDNMTLGWPIALFGLHLSIGVVAAVFFNLSDSQLQLAGIILNVFSIILGNMKTVRQLIRFVDGKKRPHTKI
ncbi:hypothetical protein KVR01_013369 [Diaporthe batatas]|uniref:uncharacterized protein n=1 Tax=Diaporthe batatas TaxID=748121 RepID=UPI001D0574CC|nr:uncharacterized protein KVR01_013369 [Diaporthe batatas]KAG8156764.1 hypothetical protein KVR01_013369 [Diaporthe batatas]